MIVMTLGEIYKATKAIANIMNRPRNLPHAAKFQLARIYDRLLPVAETIDAENKKLVYELGEEAKDEQGNVRGWQLKEANREEYDRRFAAVCAPTHDLSIRPLPVALFGTATENGIEVSEFHMLGPLVTE